MQKIFKAINHNNILEVQEILNANPGAINSQDTDKNTPLHLAILKKDTVLIDFLLQYALIDTNIKNDTCNTALIFAIKYNDVDSVKLLLAHPNTDLSLYVDSYAHPLLYPAISDNHYEITRLIVEALPFALHQRDKFGFNALRFVGNYRYTHETTKIVEYLLHQSDVAASVLEQHENDISNCFVNIFKKYNSNAIESTQKAMAYAAAATMLFYYQKQFTNLDTLYSILLSEGNLQSASKFILDLQYPHLERLILQSKIESVIQEKFNLRTICDNQKNVLHLATQLWYSWSFKEKMMLKHYSICYEFLTQNDEATKKLCKDSILENDKPKEDLANRVCSLPREIRDIVLAYILGHTAIPKIVKPSVLNMSIPYTHHQQKKAFHALLKGMAFFQPSTFIYKTFKDKTSIVRTPFKELSTTAIKEESTSIKNDIHKDATQQLKLFEFSRP